MLVVLILKNIFNKKRRCICQECLELYGQVKTPHTTLVISLSTDPGSFLLPSTDAGTSLLLSTNADTSLLPSTNSSLMISPQLLNEISKDVTGLYKEKLCRNAETLLS